MNYQLQKEAEVVLTPQENLEPKTPLIHPHTPRSEEDPNEVLLGNNEISEDESED